jgi:hypothetical protein
VLARCFQFDLVRIFEKLLGMGSLEWPQIPLLHQHVNLPIFSEGLDLIFVERIAQTSYLKI